MKIKLTFAICVLMHFHQVVIAQPTQQQSIEDTQFGWMKVYHYKGAKEIKKVDNRTFSIAQLSIIDSLANWMQASYLPKGGIGDIRKNVFPAASPYSPYNVAWPQGYGATAYTWAVAYKQGKPEPVQESETGWSIAANEVPGWPIRDVSTDKQYYFTMPSFQDDAVKREQDLSNAENLKPYITFWLKNIEVGNGTEYVLLCKDNKSPFIKITKGEYLKVVEAGISRAYQKEKNSIYEKNAGNQKSIDYFMKYLEEKNSKRLICLANTKENHRNRLQEIAETPSAQPDIMLENVPDIFEGNGASIQRYPIYTIDPAAYELAKKDKPLWIVAGWNWAPTNPKEKFMHESIINNFNFTYVYNFFFYPDKIKGPYRPLRSPVQKEVLVLAAKSDNSLQIANDNSVFYFEDFSTTTVGNKPTGWYTKSNIRGVHPMVKSQGNAPGKWVTLEGNNLTPTNLKKPLPQNFTLSYEVIAAEDFTWGAKGLVLLLSKEKTPGAAEAFIRLKIRPGAGGANGEVTLETKFPSGYANETKWYVAQGFSNNKKINQVKLTIKKKGENLQVLVDNEKIAEYTQGLPSDLLFNALSFEMADSNGSPDVYYLSNIKITKD